jgi:hypothetical protein
LQVRFLFGPESSAALLGDLRQRSVFVGRETGGDTSEKPAFKAYERDCPLQEVLGKLDRFKM